MRSAWIVGAFLLAAAVPARAQDFTIEVQLQGRYLQGLPLAWSPTDVLLLGRDGCLWRFSPEEAKSYRKVAGGFQGYSPSDLRSQLSQEFGRAFDVSGTGHYLVVHPAGQRDAWAGRFEELYRSFVHYFTARGWSPQPPRFPLIAVVFPRQQDFLRHAAAEGASLEAATLGYYSPKTNRILLYDVTAGQPSRDDWHVNAQLIIHEATHQTAFNTGIHNRFSVPPHFVAEGLATMFEARGVWNWQQSTGLQERIHGHRLAAFQKYAASRRKKGSLAQFVATDDRFRSDPEAAYAEAWALTFFLAETSSRKYVDYLRKTASRQSFTPYDAAERIRDFQAAFGDLALVEAHFLRFIAQLK